MNCSCMSTECENLLKELMAADFTVIELNLYLDTHPNDQQAITLYNQWVQRAKMLREKYEKMCGPLTIRFISNCPYDWVQTPWPWERRF